MEKLEIVRRSFRGQRVRSGNLRSGRVHPGQPLVHEPGVVGSLEGLAVGDLEKEPAEPAALLLLGAVVRERPRWDVRQKLLVDGSLDRGLRKPGALGDNVRAVGGRLA